MRIDLSIAWTATLLLWPAAGQTPAGTGNPYGRAAQLPARILNFTAQPASIQPGQSATLLWSTENQSGTTIEPGVGDVTARSLR